MLREWTGDWIGTFVGHKGAVWSTKLSRDGSRAASGSADFTACVFYMYGSRRVCGVALTGFCRKIWDTYSGQPLHSFPHNHIVRSVAISPSGTHLLTGGQEKKVRIFDIGRPDAEPDILSEGNGQSHDGTVKSVVWFDENTGVSGGEDGVIKWVLLSYSRISVWLRNGSVQRGGGIYARANLQRSYRSKTRSPRWNFPYKHSDSW